MNVLDLNFKKVDKDYLFKNLNNGSFSDPTKKEYNEILSRFENAINNSDYLISRNTAII